MAKVQIKIQKNHILVSFLPIKQQVVVSLHKLTPIQSYLLYLFLLTIFCISPIQRPRYFSSSYAHIKKRITIVFRANGNLSAPHHLTCFLNIETWKHSPIVLIPIFLADPPYVPTKLKLFTSNSLATRPKHEEPKRPTPLHQQTSL